MDNAMTEMPYWRCHKEVHAAKITDIADIEPNEYDRAAVAVLTLDDSMYAYVDAEYMAKHRPVVGGYYVVYEGGYKSFSPADAFESGYTRIR